MILFQVVCYGMELTCATLLLPAFARRLHLSPRKQFSSTTPCVITSLMESRMQLTQKLRPLQLLPSHTISLKKCLKATTLLSESAAFSYPEVNVSDWLLPARF